MSTLSQTFIRSPQFAVVGASTNRSKFGNRILRWYKDHGLSVTPINPKEAVIEEIPAITSIEQLPNPTQTAISIITPPSVTLGVLEKAKELGIKSIWIQPGGEDKAVLDYAKASGLDIIAGGPCLLVDGPHLLANRSQL